MAAAAALAILDSLKPELVIFDCDGVLVDTERMEVSVLAEALSWYGIDHDAALILEQSRGGSLARLQLAIEEIHGEPLPEDFADRYRAHQLTVLPKVPAIEGAVEAIEAAGSNRCVASGGPMYKMEVTLKATDLWDHFAPNIFSCYDIDSHKPEPDIYLHAAAALGIEPARCLVIEDSATGVRASATAGMFVIGLARDTVPASLLDAGAQITVPTMVEASALISRARS